MYLLHFQTHQNVVRDLECEGTLKVLRTIMFGTRDGPRGCGVCNLGFQVLMFELCMAYILRIHLATFQVMDNLVYYGLI